VLKNLRKRLTEKKKKITLRAQRFCDNLKKMTENERLKTLRKQLGFSQADFSEKLGIKQGSYSDIERGRNKVSASILMKLQEVFNINTKWIQSGKGDIYAKPDSKISGRENVRTIKYYDLDATASIIQVFEAGDKYQPSEIMVPGFSDCELAMNVWGDSMEPDFHSGEIVLLKHWRESFIEYGRVYLIITKNDHRMLKILYPGKTDETVSLVSKNEFYPPVEIKKNEILRLFLVKGHISRLGI
jgi:transcriptional regulator with XRE-family HTH domain